MQVSSLSTKILRYSFALLFIWFGSQQVLHPEMWVGFLPEWVGYFPIPAEMLIQLNGWSELIGALFLLTGTYIKPVSILLSLHLLGIALETRGAIGVRDAILAMIGIALYFSPADNWTVDAYHAKTRK